MPWMRTKKKGYGRQKTRGKRETNLSASFPPSILASFPPPLPSPLLHRVFSSLWWRRLGSIIHSRYLDGLTSLFPRSVAWLGYYFHENWRTSVKVAPCLRLLQEVRSKEIQHEFSPQPPHNFVSVIFTTFCRFFPYITDSIIYLLVHAIFSTLNANNSELKQRRRQRQGRRLVKNELIFYQRNSQVSWSGQ